MADELEDPEGDRTRFEALASQFSLAGPMGDYPGLRHFFGAYLGLDFVEEFGDWREAVRRFKADEPHAVQEVSTDLRRVREARLTEAELTDLLTELNCGVNRDMGHGSWTAWLGRLAQELDGP